MPALQAAGGAAIAGQRLADRPRRLWALAYAIAAVGFLADLGAKTLAIASLDPTDPPVFLGGLVTLQLIFNPGAAFSMGEGFTPVLTCIALAAFAFVGGWMIPRAKHVGWAVAEGFLLAGITGNLVDRLFRAPGPFRGHVVDFIQLPNFAIFNVADTWITTAAVLIIWLVLIRQVGSDGRSTKEAAPAASVAGDA